MPKSVAPRPWHRWLDPRQGALLAPLQGRWNEAPTRLGQLLAQQHGEALPGGQGAGFMPRLHANVALLRAAQAQLAQLNAQGQAVGAAGDWLLDHIDSLAAQTRAVREGLPRRYYRQLPKLAHPELAGTPRVLGIAWAFVEHGDSQFDAAALTAFVQGYQLDGAALTLGELWALPTSLRVVLIENLRRLVERQPAAVIRPQ